MQRRCHQCRSQPSCLISCSCGAVQHATTSPLLNANLQMVMISFYTSHLLLALLLRVLQVLHMCIWHDAPLLFK